MFYSVFPVRWLRDPILILSSWVCLFYEQEGCSVAMNFQESCNFLHIGNTVSSRDESLDSRDECLVSRGCWENYHCQLSDPFRIVHDWNEGFDIWNYVLNARGYVGKRENTRYARGVLMTFPLSGLFLLWFFYCICSVYHQSSSRELPYHCINTRAKEVSFEENQKSVCFGGELYFCQKGCTGTVNELAMTRR